MAIENRVKKLIVEQLKCDIDQIVPYAELINDLGADSISMIDLMMNIENEFDLDIKEEDIKIFFKVQDIYDYIEAYC